MDYPQAVAFLYSCLNYEIKTDYDYARDLNLERTRHFLALAGNPEKKIRCILVGGTKGKGSTAAFLASILSAAGYKTGLYTSPHLISPCERIRIDGTDVSEADFARLMTRVQELSQQAEKQYGELTFFEILTAAAFCFFAEKQVDCAVVEVGMGGRLDATNVVDALLSLILPVSLDHQDKLGNTVQEIAREKAAIIKPHGLLVSAAQAPAAEKVLREYAARQEAEVFFLGQDFSGNLYRADQEGSEFSFQAGAAETHGLKINLPGIFQWENALCAVQAARLLRDKWHFEKIDAAALRYGLEKTSWPGRFQVLSREPGVILDGAHNPAAFQALRISLQTLFPEKKICLLFGVSREKDLSGMAAEIALLKPEKVYCAGFSNPRALAPAEMAAVLRTFLNCPVICQENPRAAFTEAKENLREDEVLVIAGSLFLAGEVLSWQRGEAVFPGTEKEALHGKN